MKTAKPLCERVLYNNQDIPDVVEWALTKGGLIILCQLDNHYAEQLLRSFCKETNQVDHWAYKAQGKLIMRQQGKYYLLYKKP